MSNTSRSAKAGELADAVGSADLNKAARLLEAGADPNDTNSSGKQAILIAAGSNQFVLVKLLMDHGADIWATTKLGHCVGSFAYHSRVDPSTDDGRAHKEVVARLQAAGYPPPPMYAKDVRGLRDRGEWPPAGATDARGNPIKRQ